MIYSVDSMPYAPNDSIVAVMKELDCVQAVIPLFETISAVVYVDFITFMSFTLYMQIQDFSFQVLNIFIKWL